MKKLNLIKRLWTDSHEKQKPQRFARYAAMLIMLLTLGVGQMWADPISNISNVWMEGTMNSWTTKPTNWEWTNDDGNHYTATFYIPYSSTNYEFKIRCAGSGWTAGSLFSGDGYWYTSSNTGEAGRWMKKSNAANDQIQCKSKPTSNYIKLTCNFWGAYGDNSYLKIEQSDVAVLSPSLSCTPSGTSLSGGNSRTLNASCTGGSGDYNYSYVVTCGGDDVTASTLSASSGASVTFTAPVAATEKTYTVTVTASDSHALLSGLATKTATKNFTVAATLTPTIAWAALDPISSYELVSGQNITLKVTRTNSSNNIIFYKKVGSGSWTQIADQSSTTYTYTLPANTGATQTYYFKAALKDGSPYPETSASSAVSVYGKKTLHVKNREGWASMYLYGGDGNTGAWPGTTSTGSNGFSIAREGSSQWYTVVITSANSEFLLNNGGSGSGNQTGNLSYGSYSDGGYYECYNHSGKTVDGRADGQLYNSTAPTAPTSVTTTATPTSVTNVQMTLGGSIGTNGNDNITDYGFYWGTTDACGTKAQVGTSNTTGSISKQLTGLTAGTTYYFKTYATNGQGTSYGDVQNYKLPYKVTVSTNTGCESITNSGTNYTNSTIEVTATKTTGYTFSSWTTTKGTQTSTSSTSTTNTLVFTPSADNATIQPVYTENMTTVNLIASPAGKGTFTSSEAAVTSVSAGVATKPTVTAVPATGYHLAGTIWSESSEYISLSSTNTEATTITATGATGKTADLTATFTPNTYTVRFHRNGGAGDVVNQDFTYDAAQNLTANTYTKTGYSFAGWATSTSGEVVYANSVEVSNLTATNEGTYHLYAKWTPNPYTVVLDKQTSAEGYGGNEGTVANQTVTFDATPAAVSGTMPSAANGYAFMGFFSAEDGEGRQFINPSGEWVANAGDTISGGNWVKPAGIILYAYYKKAEITGIALSSGTVLPEGPVTATATIEPTPTPTTIICWKLLYNNGTEYSPQPTFTPVSGSEVSFNAPEASGTYKVQAQLRTGGVCGGGTLLSENETSFIVAGTHNVTIQYKCDGVNVKAATVVEGVKPLEWSETITPGDEPFGYTFARWEAGDGVSITDDDGASTKTTTTSSSIKIKAIYDGRLTAVYTQKQMIYFKNTLGWENVYFHNSYWDNSQGGAGNKGQTRNQSMSLVPGETDIYYWEGTPGTNVAFTDHTYIDGSDGYQAFWSKTFDANVVYPSNPACAASGDNNYGYNAGTPMFVPIEQDAITFNESNDGKALYYNKGYWRAYDPTTGESGSTGYTLKIYNQTEGNSSRKLLQSIPFTNADASGQIFKATAGLNAAVGYGIKVERDNSLMYTNTTGHLNGTGDVETLSVHPDNYAAIWIKSTAAGDYDFIITCNGSGQLCLQATFPAAENDYRVLYTDNATWSNTAHTARTWGHPSRVISAEAGATDTISFFVSKDNSPEYKIQRVSGIDEGTGAITWADVTSWTSISVAKTGVYNFIFNQPAAGSISLSKTEEYDGNFYIRTNNAGSTKWENYRTSDHEMTYSEYAAKITHTGEEWKDFTHYFMKYVDKDKESGKYKNVMFTVANDYSPCISDTLVQQAGDIASSHVNASGDLQANANIRFMWNIKNNKLQRAYLAAAQSDGTKFLVLQGKSGELLAPDGTALSDENSNNHGGGTDAIQFTDKEHWMYDAEVKAVPGGRVKLYAVFNGSTFYYYGDGDASFDESHAIELISGSGGAQDIRVIYDFKTDRLIAAWVPSDGDISIKQTINADIMLIREHQNAGKQINLVGTGSISTDKTVYGVMRFNRWTLNNKSTVNTGTTENPVHAVLPVGEQKSQYERFNYMISFPFDVKVGEIFGFGTIGRHYRIYYYDGLGRAKEGFFAERGDDNWRMIDDTDSILHANQGYLLQLNYIRMADDNTATWPQKNMNEVELYFPAMNEINTIKLDNVDVPALGDAYKCKINLKPTYEAQGNPKADEADRRVKDSYWRCIGVPGFTSYEANAGTWENFNWKAETDSLPYLYEWHMENNKLSVVSSSTFTFKPMHAYLIQNGKSFTWKSVAHPTLAAAPRRSAAEEGFYEFYLEMQNGEQALDHTYVRLTDKENITADFDFGQDLSKELNSGANIFTKVGYERLAANNLPLSEQTTIVPVGVKIAAEGNYTFAMPEGTHGIGVTLVDNETGDRTNLSLFDYSVNLTKGDYDNRFILEISPIQQMPTDIDNVQGESAQSEKARKVMIDGILYIVKDGVVFDARGSRVK